MNFTDIFIRKPVLATTISLLILVLGVRSLVGTAGQPVSEDAERRRHDHHRLLRRRRGRRSPGFITQPLEGAIAQAQGIDYLSSTSTTGVSTITATLRLNYDANRALTEINTQVNSVRNQLPPQAQQPVLTCRSGRQIDAMYMGFFSDVAAEQQRHRLPGARGQAEARFDRRRADRRNPRRAHVRAARLARSDRMAAHGVTATDVRTALGNNNYLAALGTTKGQMVSVDLTAGTDLHSVDEFKKLVVKQQGGAIVRLEDVATVVLGAENYDFNGVRRAQLGVHRHQGRAGGQRARRGRSACATCFPASRPQMPNGMTGEIVYDATKFINTSINEVIKTLVEALLIVSRRHLPVPGQLARGRHSADRDAAVADRRLLRDAGARLLDQPADAAGAGAGDRAGRRRRDHRGRERRPAHEGGQVADGGGADRGARARAARSSR